MENCSRAAQLKKWKEEKLLKQQEEIKHKKPPFRCGLVTPKPPPFLNQYGNSIKKMGTKPLQVPNMYRRETAGKALKDRNTGDNINKPHGRLPSQVLVKQIDGRLTENFYQQSDKAKTLGKSLPCKTVPHPYREKILLPKESTPYHPAKQKMLWDLESIKNLSRVEPIHTSSTTKGQVTSTLHPAGLT